MSADFTLAVRHFEPTKDIEQQVAECARQLRHFHPRLERCDVVLDWPQRGQNTGNPFEVRVSAVIPGVDIQAAKALSRTTEAEDIRLAINRAFAAARRQLQDRDRQSDIHRHKPHDDVLHGQVERLNADEGFGFISVDGEEYYFSREALTSDFWSRLEPGQMVRFRGSDGEDGPYASNVTLTD